MPARDGYNHGTPSWVDLSSPDMDATSAFYAGLFGWGTEETGTVEETGGYQMFTIGDKVVAGHGPLTEEAAAQGQPPAWSTYFAVDSVDDVVAKATGLGATAMMPGMDVMTAGRMAFLFDPTGAAFGLWQAGDHKGAQLINEPNTLCWNELATTDVDAAVAFYTGLFDHTNSPQDMGPMGIYNTVGAGTPEGLYGIAGMPPGAPAGIPSHWSAVFAVADADAAFAKVADLGGAQIHGPMDIPVGRFAVVADPCGAAFEIITMSDETS